MHQVSASGGSPVAVTSTDGTPYTSHRWPQFLPDGRHFLFLGVQQEEGRDQSAVFIGSLGGRTPQVVLRSRSQAIYADGQLLFLRDRTLWAQPFDVDREALGGRAGGRRARRARGPDDLARHLQHVGHRHARSTRAARPARPDDVRPRLGTRSGQIGERGIIFDVNISPDGTRVAVNRGEPADIWVYELGRGTSLRLTFDVRNETLPVWSADSQRLAFNQTQKDATTAVYEIPAAGGAPRQVLPAGDLAVTDWSRDGRVMLMRQGELFISPGDIWAKPMDGAPRALLRTPFAEFHARFSPDTRWVSYVSNESGRDEVYVMPFAMPEAGATAPVAAGDRVRISTAGGVLPRWRRDGRELFYLSPDLQVMAAALDANGTRIEVRSVTPLFSLNPKPVGWVFDVMPDGQRSSSTRLATKGGVRWRWSPTGARRCSRAVARRRTPTTETRRTRRTHGRLVRDRFVAPKDRSGAFFVSPCLCG